MSISVVAAPARALCAFLRFSLIAVMLSSAGLVSSSAQNIPSGPQNVAYTYDALGRLQTVTYEGLASDGGDIKYTYTYDPAGNRTVLLVEGTAFPAIYLQDVYVVEGDIIRIPVFVSANPRGDVQFNWTVVSGGEQVGVVSGTFLEADVDRIGQVGFIEIATVQNTLKQGVVPVVIEISQPEEGVVIDPANDEATAYVQDDDITYFTIGDKQVTEGGDLVFDVTRTIPASANTSADPSGITVSLTTVDMTAERGVDYTEVDPVDVTFALAGPAVQTVTVETLFDDALEGDEQFRVLADWTAEAFPSQTAAFGTIENGANVGTSSFTVESRTFNEGGTAGLMVERVGATGRQYDVAFTILGSSTAAAGAGADYTLTTSSPFTFLAGQSQKAINFDLNADGDDTEGDETIVVQVSWSDPENGAQTASGTLTINDGTGGGEPPVGNTAPVAVDDTDAYQLPIIAYDDPGTGTEFDADAANIPNGAIPIYGGTGSFNVIANDTDDDGDALVVQSVSVAAGSPSPLEAPAIAPNGTNITATFNQCGTYSFDYTVADPSGATDTGVLTVTTTPMFGGNHCVEAGSDPAPTGGKPTVTVADNNPEVMEGDPLAFTLNLSNKYRHSVHVDFTLAGTAVKGTDYDVPAQYQVPGEPGLYRVTFGFNIDERVIALDTADFRDVVDGDRTVVLTITNARNGDLGTALSETGTIKDNDTAGNGSPLLLPDDFDVVMQREQVINGESDSFIGQGTFDVLANDSDPDGDALTLLDSFRLIQNFGGSASADTLSVVGGQVSGVFAQCGYYRFEYDVVDTTGARSTSFFNIDARVAPGAPQADRDLCPDPVLPLNPDVPEVNIAASANVEEGGTLIFPVTLTEEYPDPVAIGWSVTNNAGDALTTEGVLSFNPGQPLTQNIELVTDDDTTAEGDETVTVTLTTLVNADAGTITATATVTDNEETSTAPVIGEALFTTPGTYSWTAPAGVTSVSVVAVGGGGGLDSNNKENAGGGGALAWKNNIAVTAGSSLTVIVGQGGIVGQNGGNSSFAGVLARGGVRGGSQWASGGTFSGADGGGVGGRGIPDSYYSSTTGVYGDGGGGGAGGYSGKGGDGTTKTLVAQSGAGGGGAGGSAGGGGGVGLHGQGSSGISSVSQTGGQGGSGGASGAYSYRNSHGGGYGGGAGGYGTSSTNTAVGGSGAVRIIWGPGLSFPNAAELSDADSTPVQQDPPTFSIADATAVTEGGALSFTVTKVGSTTDAYTVSYGVTFGTADAADITSATSGTVVFGSGDPTQTITINTFDDTIDEFDSESLSVVLTSADGGALGTAVASGAILDNDAGSNDGSGDGTGGTPPDPTLPTISMSGTPTGADEGDTLLFPVSISSAPDGTATATWAVTTGASEVTVSSGTVNFTVAGTQTITVPTIDDPDEFDETVTIRLTAVSENALLDGTLSASATITDGDVTVANRAPSASPDFDTITATPVGVGDAVTASLSYNVLTNDSDPDGDALTLVDNLSMVTTSGFVGLGSGGTVSVSAGGVINLDVLSCGTRRIAYTVQDPDGLTDTSYLQVEVNGPANCPVEGAAPPATPPSFRVNNASATEGGTVSFTVTMTGETAQSYSVDYATSSAGSASSGDFTAKSGTLTFGASASGSATQQVTVATDQDSEPEDNETFILTLSNASGGAAITDSSGTGTIIDDEPAPTPPVFRINDASVSEGGTVTFTVTRTGTTSQSYSVNYATATGSAGTGDFTAKSGTLTFPASSQTTGTLSIQVSTIEDSTFESNETFFVNLSGATGGAVVDDPQGIGTITNDDPEPQTPVYTNGSVSWGTCQPNGTRSGTYVRTCTLSPSGASCGTQTLSTSGTCTPPETEVWSDGPISWGTCSSSGTRTGTYTQTCTTSPNGYHCGSRTRTTSDSCTAPVTYTYHWEYGGWGDYGTCNNGSQTRTRSSTCIRDQDGAVASSGNCGPSNASETRSCSTTTYSWVTSNWSPWQCTGTGFIQERSRSRSCQSSSGADVNQSNCSGTPPSTYESRTNETACGGGTIG